MKFKTYTGPFAPSAPVARGAYSTTSVAEAPERSNPSAAARARAILFLMTAIAIAVAYLGGRAMGAAAGEVASDVPPRSADLKAAILSQIEQMNERGMIVAIHDGSPTVVVVTDRYIECISTLSEELPLYGGHFVGFAGDYAWQVHGHHNVRLVREDGTEIGRRTGPITDGQVQQIYIENRRRLESASAAVNLDLE